MQRKGHGTHTGGARDPGDGASPLHRGPVVRLPDWRQTLPHTGVPEWWVWCKQNLKLQTDDGVLPAPTGLLINMKDLTVSPAG